VRPVGLRARRCETAIRTVRRGATPPNQAHRGLHLAIVFQRVRNRSEAPQQVFLLDKGRSSCYLFLIESHCGVRFSVAVVQPPFRLQRPKYPIRNIRGDTIMRRVLCSVLAAGTIAAMAVPANAGGRDFATGLFGGLAAGAIIGSASRPYYGPPSAYYYDGPRYYGAYDGYGGYGGYCHWERGRRYWDDYEGVWRRTRVRVCD
jgi:hypothetical protein